MTRKLKIYSPLYNKYKIPSATSPDIYNASGDKMEMFFIRDIHCAHAPYDGTGKYFIWDRYNFGLKTHFYTHNAMLQTMGQPTRKYGMFVESREIVPKDYTIFKKHKGLEHEFDKIFTFDDEILNNVSNAAFYPAAAEVWYGKGQMELLSDTTYQRKTKNVSFLSSDKAMCEMHKIRIAAARYCHANRLADVYGKVIGGGYVTIETPLTEYRYSFAIENNQTDYYFTEKIINCFAAQTIPIYYGARKISEFFNEDGIIYITKEDLQNIEPIIQKCTIEEYERRLPAIQDNYQRVMKYLNIQDYLYENYLVNNSKTGGVQL